MSGGVATIYIVDDDDLVLWLYQELLRGVALSFKVFTCARAFLDSYSPGPYECLICDLRMPQTGGLDLQRELVAAGACLPIIFVSAYSEVSAVVEAIKAGAFDFLEKPVDGIQLREKVAKALEYSRGLHLERMRRAARAARVAQLTLKERQIVNLVVAGRSSREISSELGISTRTVENHRARISEKLHVGSTVELVRLFCDLNQVFASLPS